MLIECDINEYDDTYIELCSLSTFFLQNLNSKRWHSQIRISDLKRKYYKAKNIRIDDYNMILEPYFVKKISTHSENFIPIYKNLNHIVLNDMFLNDIDLRNYKSIKDIEVNTRDIKITLSEETNKIYAYKSTGLEIDFTEAKNIKEISFYSNLFITGIYNCKNLEFLSITNLMNINYNKFKNLINLSIIFSTNSHLNLCELTNLLELTILGFFDSELDLSNNIKLIKFNSMISKLNSKIIFPKDIETISLGSDYDKKINFINFKKLNSITLIKYKHEIEISNSLEYIYIDSFVSCLNLKDCYNLKHLTIKEIRTLIFPKINNIEKLDVDYSKIIDFQKFKNLKYLKLKNYSHPIKLYNINLISLILDCIVKSNIYLLSSTDLIELEIKSYCGKLDLRNNYYLEKLIIHKDFTQELNLKNLIQLKEVKLPKYSKIYK